MRIPLNTRQRRELQPYIDRVRSAATLGTPGMLVAQIHWSDTEGSCWMTPAFLDHDHARIITEQGRTLESVSSNVSAVDTTLKAGT